jgi:hypothetical protein
MINNIIMISKSLARNILASVCLMLFVLHPSLVQSRARWTEDQANEWYKKQGWFAGCNYIPRTAVNVLEMW